MGASLFCANTLIVPLLVSLAPQVSDVVSGHEASIARVRLIDSTHQILGSRDVANPDATTIELSTCHWTADLLNDRERFRFKTNQKIRANHPATRQGNYEILSDRTDFRVIMASDWDQRERLTPFQQSGIKCWIDPTFGDEPLFRMLRPTEHLMWSFSLSLNAFQQRSLRELVGISDEIRITGTGTVANRSTFQLLLRPRPEVLDAYLMASSDDPLKVGIEFYIDVDQESFSILKYRQKYSNVLSKNVDGTESRSTAEWTNEVVEWRTFADGILFPIKTTMTNTHDGRVIGRTATRFVSVTVNEPIKPEDLALRFPEYALVEHRPAVNGRTKVELWGADDKPIKEIIDEVEDLKEFLHLAPRFAEEQSNSNRKWFWVLIAGVITVASVVWFRRRK